MPELEQLSTVAGIIKDLTVAGFILWILLMMMTGKLVRREELDREIARTTASESKADWWRDRFLGIVDTTKESISSLKATVEASLAALGRRQ